MTFTRPPALPIMGEGGAARVSIGNSTATWSPKLSSTTRSESDLSGHSIRKASHAPLCTARTVSALMAGSGGLGSVTVWGSIVTLTGRDCRHAGAAGSVTGPTVRTRTAVSGAWAGDIPTQARTARRASGAYRERMVSVSLGDIGAEGLVLGVVHLADD